MTDMQTATRRSHHRTLGWGFLVLILTSEGWIGSFRPERGGDAVLMTVYENADLDISIGPRWRPRPEDS